MILVLLLVSCGKDASKTVPETVSPPQATLKPKAKVAANVELRVLGMTCPESCVTKVKQGLLAEKGVVSVDIQYENQLAMIGVDKSRTVADWNDSLVTVLNDAGYKAWPTSDEKEQSK